MTEPVLEMLAHLKRFVSTWTFIFVVDEGRIENFTCCIVFTPSDCFGCDMVARGNREMVKVGNTNNMSFNNCFIFILIPKEFFFEPSLSVDLKSVNYTALRQFFLLLRLLLHYTTDNFSNLSTEHRSDKNGEK